MDTIRSAVKGIMRLIARGLDKLSGGKLSPDAITITALLAHLPIAWLIAARHPVWAGLLLIVFGLFDTLDGELARLQKTAGNRGMFLDSTTDRAKEILIYVGASYAFVAVDKPYMAVWAVAACGASLLVSYINAWGEVALSAQRTKDHQVNKSFRSGLMSFDLRLSVLIIGLLFNLLAGAVILVTVLTLFTAAQRMANVIKNFDDKS